MGMQRASHLLDEAVVVDPEDDLPEPEELVDLLQALGRPLRPLRRVLVEVAEEGNNNSEKITNNLLEIHCILAFSS